MTPTNSTGALKCYQMVVNGAWVHVSDHTGRCQCGAMTPTPPDPRARETALSREQIFNLWNTWRKSLGVPGFTHSDGVRFVRALDDAIAALAASPAPGTPNPDVEVMAQYVIKDGRVQVLPPDTIPALGTGTPTLAQLQSLEWAKIDDYYVRHCCPACDGLEPFEEGDDTISGHSSDCWLAAAIAGFSPRTEGRP